MSRVLTFQAYYARLSIDGGTHWLSQATGLPTASWSSLPIGATATVQIASVSRLGSTSAFTASQALTVSGTATNPGAPTITSAIGGFKSVLLTWTNNPPNADYAYTEIWSSQTNNLSTAILEGTAKGTSWTTTGSGWFTGLSIYWWLRNVNTSNLASGYSSGQFSGFSDDNYSDYRKSGYCRTNHYCRSYRCRTNHRNRNCRCYDYRR